MESGIRKELDRIAHIIQPVCRFTVPRVTVGPGPVCDLVMPDLLAWLRLYASYFCKSSVCSSRPSSLSDIFYLLRLLTIARSRQTPPLRLPAPLPLRPCGWESRQCMQQQQRGAHSFLCGVRISESNSSPPSSAHVVLTLPHVLSPSSPQSHPSSTKMLRC